MISLYCIGMLYEETILLLEKTIAMCIKHASLSYVSLGILACSQHSNCICFTELSLFPKVPCAKYSPKMEVLKEQIMNHSSWYHLE